MLGKVLVDAINDQINNEFYASYLYLSMSAFCESINFSGFASWLNMQSVEETGHGMRLYNFLIDCDEKIVLKAIKAPPSEYASLLSLFEEVLSHEMHVTKCINNLYGLAQKENAFVVQTHLQWFLTEQVEGENTSRNIVEKLKLIDTDVTSLLALDRELGSRAAVEPTPG